jgi:hypothetical protein
VPNTLVTRSLVPDSQDPPGKFRQGCEDLSKLLRPLGKAKEEDRKLYLHTLQKMGRWRVSGKIGVVYAPQIQLPLVG